MADAQSTIPATSDETILCYQLPSCVLYDYVRDGIVYRVYPDHATYRLGENGTIWSLKHCREPGRRRLMFWRKLKPNVHSGGYLQVHFYDNYVRTPKFLHRLVLETFVGPCPDEMQACHNNGDRSDNRLENLRWDTVANNHADKVEHGTLLKGSTVGNSKLVERDISIIMALGDAGVFQWQIAQAFGVSQTNIGCILRGKSWKHLHDDETHQN